MLKLFFKKILFISLFVFILMKTSKADYFEINSYGKVVSISKMARVGKISIFIVSTDWCAPCKVLRNKLLKSKLDMKTIDIWYINMSGGHSYKDLKKTKAYSSWRLHERLSEWPTVYITSPNTNVVKKFSSTSLEQEDKIRKFNSKPQRNITVYKNILRIINILKRNSKAFNENIVMVSLKKDTDNDTSKKVKNNNIEKKDTITDTSKKVKDNNIEKKDTITDTSKKVKDNNIEKKDTNIINDTSTINNIKEKKDSNIMIDTLTKIKVKGNNIEKKDTSSTINKSNFNNGDTKNVESVKGISINKIIFLSFIYITVLVVLIISYKKTLK